MTADDTTIRIWDVPTGRSTGVVIHAGGRIQRLVSSADGRRLISTVIDAHDVALVQVWDSNTGQPVGYPYRLDPVPWEAAATLDERGRRIVTANRDPERGVIWRSFDGHVRLDGWPALREAACGRAMGGKARYFSQAEIDADPLLLRMWPERDRDVCL